MKEDTTKRILNELEVMMNENAFNNELNLRVKELVQKVNFGEENLFNYRRSNSIEKYGEDLIKAISEANQRQQSKR